MHARRGLLTLIICSSKRITGYWQGNDYDEVHPEPLHSVYTIGHELAKVGNTISHLSKTVLSIYKPFLTKIITELVNTPPVDPTPASLTEALR